MKNTDKKSSKKKSNIFLNILLVIFILIFIGSGAYLFNYYYKSYKNEKMVKDLFKLVEDEEPSENENIASPGQAVEKYITLADGRKILKKFKKIYDTNNDFMGWLKVDGTAIDYPVVYTPDDEQKYLRADFENNYLIAGTLFLSAASVPEKPGNNMIIYGHNMQNGTMFSDLLSYKEREYYKAHKYLSFDSLYFENRYEVIAAFPVNVNTGSFDYYNHSGVLDEKEFDEYLKKCYELSSYEFDSKAVYGDELLTLSTCDSYGSKEGNRYVVVAKKIETK